jgi:hypothetical protein
MTEDSFIALMDAFDALDGAAQRVIVAQPSQMTDAAEKLDTARLAMREVLQSAIRSRISHQQ